MLRALILVCVAAGVVLGEDGYSDLDSGHWGYQWYIGKPFHFFCNSTDVIVTPEDNVTWITPNKKVLYNGHDDTVWKVDGIELTLKSVQPAVHGVYVCQIHNETNSRVRAQMIFGINVYAEKYNNLMDKYRHNIIVACIATAVFVVPLATVCFVSHFQYLTPEQKQMIEEKRRSARKSGVKIEEIQMANTVQQTKTDTHNNAFNTPL